MKRYLTVLAIAAMVLAVLCGAAFADDTVVVSAYDDTGTTINNEKTDSNIKIYYMPGADVKFGVKLAIDSINSATFTDSHYSLYTGVGPDIPADPDTEPSEMAANFTFTIPSDQITGTSYQFRACENSSNYEVSNYTSATVTVDPTEVTFGLTGSPVIQPDGSVRFPVEQTSPVTMTFEGTVAGGTVTLTDMELTETDLTAINATAAITDAGELTLTAKTGGFKAGNTQTTVQLKDGSGKAEVDSVVVAGADASSGAVGIFNVYITVADTTPGLAADQKSSVDYIKGSTGGVKIGLVDCPDASKITASVGSTALNSTQATAAANAITILSGYLDAQSDDAKVTVTVAYDGTDITPDVTITVKPAPLTPTFANGTTTASATVADSDIKFTIKNATGSPTKVEQTKPAPAVTLAANDQYTYASGDITFSYANYLSKLSAGQYEVEITIDGAKLVARLTVSGSSSGGGGDTTIKSGDINTSEDIPQGITKVDVINTNQRPTTGRKVSALLRFNGNDEIEGGMGNVISDGGSITAFAVVSTIRLDIQKTAAGARATFPLTVKNFRRKLSEGMTGFVVLVWPQNRSGASTYDAFPATVTNNVLTANIPNVGDYFTENDIIIAEVAQAHSGSSSGCTAGAASLVGLAALGALGTKTLRRRGK